MVDPTSAFSREAMSFASGFALLKWRFQANRHSSNSVTGLNYLAVHTMGAGRFCPEFPI
jgi:hypothetical protein